MPRRIAPANLPAIGKVAVPPGTMRPAQLATKGRATRRYALGFCVASTGRARELPVIQRRSAVDAAQSRRQSRHTARRTAFRRSARRGRPASGQRLPDLFAHQRAGVAFLLSRRRAILADDMGLGKSRQAIVALREAAPAGPYLVVCPAGVKLNWQREIRLVEPDADVHVVDRQSRVAVGPSLDGRQLRPAGRLEADLSARPGPASSSTRRTT